MSSLRSESFLQEACKFTSSLSLRRRARKSFQKNMNTITWIAGLCLRTLTERHCHMFWSWLWKSWAEPGSCLLSDHPRTSARVMPHAGSDRQIRNIWIMAACQPIKLPIPIHVSNQLNIWESNQISVILVLSLYSYTSIYHFNLIFVLVIHFHFSLSFCLFLVLFQLTEVFYFYYFS